MDQAKKGWAPADPPQSWLLCDSGQILCLSVPLYSSVSQGSVACWLQVGTQQRLAGLWEMPCAKKFTVSGKDPDSYRGLSSENPMVAGCRAGVTRGRKENPHLRIQKANFTLICSQLG